MTKCPKGRKVEKIAFENVSYTYVYIYICIQYTHIHIYIYYIPQTVLAQWGSYVQSKGIGCRPQRRTRRWGGAFVSMLPLWFRANSVAFRCSRCGFARTPLHFDAPAVVSRESRGLFRPLLGGSLRLPTATAHAVGRGLGFDAPAVVSREFRCVSMLPLWFRANP